MMKVNSYWGRSLGGSVLLLPTVKDVKVIPGKEIVSQHCLRVGWIEKFRN